MPARPRPAPAVEKDPLDAVSLWVQEHTRTVTAMLVVVAVLVGGALLYRRALTTRAAQAEAALLGPRQSIAANNIPLAQTDLKRILTRYPGTAAATQAAMLLATTYYSQQKVPEGLAVLQHAVTTGPGKPFASAVGALVAAGYDQEGKYRDAALAYERAAGLSPYALERDRLHAAAARSYGDGADTTAAVRLWTQLAADPKSPEAAEARLRLGELTAKPISKA